MPRTTSLHDCQRLADAVSAAGAEVPDALGNLLSAHALLAAHRPAESPEAPIMSAALNGTLNEKALDRLLPAAATAQMVDTYRGDLARRSEHTLVGAFHREIEAGAADQILDSLRDRFDEHAAAVAHARTLIDPESSAEHILAAAPPNMVAAWQALGGHLQAIGAIATVAAAFGPRLGSFSLIREYANADGYRLRDEAIMCADGPDLELDSAPFNRPDQGHRTSPWFRVPLKLHSIESARARYNRWAADQWDVQHSGPQGGWIGEDGRVHERPRPANPYRAKVST